MSEDFGLLNPVASTYLERIAREERLIDDQPRRPRNPRSKQAKKDPDSTPSEDIQQTDDSTSSQHIDLRI
jgi:hypothetical protein